MNTTITIVAVGLFVALASIVYQRRTRSKTFDGRDRTSIEEIYRRYYADSGISFEAVTTLWNEVAKTFGVDPQRLRPDDQFGKELGGGYLITSDDIDALTSIAERRARELSLVVDLKGISTLDMYIRTFGRALSTQHR